MKKVTVILLAICLLFAGLTSCDNKTKEPPIESELTSRWDGTTVDTAWYKEGDSNFTLTNASQLAGLAKLVNESTDFTDKTITLSVNVDLNGKPWTPIGGKDLLFAGTFDGGNKTISNLMIGEGGYIGLFGVVGNANIKNINIVNANVSGTERVGALIGKIAGNATIANVTVDEKSSVAGTKSNTGGIIGSVEGVFTVELENLTNNAAVKNTQPENARAAGIVAQATSSAKVTIKNCVNNGAIEAIYPGGILSALQGSTDVTMINCKNNGNLTGDYKGHMLAWLCNGARITIKDYAKGVHDDVIGAVFLGGSEDYFYHIWINEKEIFVNKLSEVTDNKLEEGAILFNNLYNNNREELSKKALDRAIGFYTYIKENKSDWNTDYTSYWKIFTAYSTFGDDWSQCLAEYNKQEFMDTKDYVTADELTAIGTQRRAKNLITIGE